MVHPVNESVKNQKIKPYYKYLNGPYSTKYHDLRSGLFLERRHLKKNSTQGLQWAYFQGFAPPEPLAEYPLATRKRFAKPLKIRPRPPNTIDVVLKRMDVTGY